MKKLVLCLALVSCGGGDSGSGTGFLDLGNGGNQSRLGDCRQQWTVQPVAGGEILHANTGPCGEFTFTLEPGLYNVTACSPGGACSASDCFQQTVSVTEDARASLDVACQTCSPCP